MSAAFRIQGDVAMPAGFLRGMHHPVLVATVAIDAFEGLPARIAAGERELDALILATDVPPAAPSEGLAGRILYWVARLQAEASWALREAGRAAAQGDTAVLFVSTLPMSHQGTLVALQWVVHAFNSFAAGEPLPVDRLAQVRKELAWHAGSSSNMPRFLRAANQLGLPWDRLTQQIFTFGQGARMRWLDSTYTDETPVLAARLARDKVQCAELLRRAGLPAPQHKLVRDEEDAASAADALGYPVVVKPADLAGGVGVTADLRTEVEVRRAYATARALSPRVLVEKHFEGRDYRLNVFHGKLFWANEKLPGGVTGDGVHAIPELVEIVNADPNRGEPPHAPLKKLVLDGEADEALARQGLSRSSIPEAGRFVRLRIVANIVRGGVPTGVLDQVHPDNAALAVRAAALLRLDIAGVDLLIPDIRQSWLESGALICEVNAQPTLGQFTAGHLYRPLLQALVPGDGRIPIALVVDCADPEALGADVMKRLAAGGCMAGWAGPQGGALGSERLASRPMSLCERGRMLLLDTRTEAAIVFAAAAELPREGLPFDRYDVLLWAGAELPRAAFATCARTCDGVTGAMVHDAPLPAMKRPVRAVDAAEAAGWLTQELLAARARHA